MSITGSRQAPDSLRMREVPQLALSATGHERWIDGCGTESAEERIDFSERALGAITFPRYRRADGPVRSGRGWMVPSAARKNRLIR